jgi:hypothetical protein
MAKHSGGLIPEGESLRRAVRWLGEQGPVTAALIEEAARRFDLSPLEEGFLLREFLPPRQGDKR